MDTNFHFLGIVKRSNASHIMVSFLACHGLPSYIMAQVVDIIKVLELLSTPSLDTTIYAMRFCHCNRTDLRFVLYFSHLLA